MDHHKPNHNLTERDRSAEAVKEVRQGGKISRRKLLASIGMAGVAVASGGLLQEVSAYTGLNNSDSNFGSNSNPGSNSTFDSNPNPNRDADNNYYRYSTDQPERTVGDKLRESVSVMDFGATGYGGANDTEAIQAALNIAKDSGKPIKVIVPEGEYLITSRMRIYEGTYLYAHGAKFIRKHPAGFLLNGDEGAAYEGYNGHGNITIDGGIFEGNIAEFPQNYNGLMFGRGRNLVFKNIEVRDVVSAHAFDLAATEDVLFDNCRFLGYHPGTLNRTFSEAIQVGEHTEEGFGLFGPFDGTPNRNVTVRNCYFGHSGTEGMQPWAVGIGHHGGVHDIFQSDIKIYGNTFEGMTYAGVRLMKFHDCIVSGNTFLDCRRGLNISSVWGNSASSRDKDGNQTGMPQAGKTTTITSNLFKRCAQSVVATGQVYEGIIANFENLIIADNLFVDQALHPERSHSLYVKWINNLVFKGNVVKNSYRAMTVIYCKNAKITENVIEDTAMDALYMNEDDGEQYTNKGHTANVDITNNTIVNVGRTGLYVQYAKRFSVIGNTVINSGTEAENTLNAITVTASAAHGLLEGNYVEGSKHRYGIEVTAACSNVRITNNDVNGLVQRTHIAGAANFDGQFLHSGNGTRYKLTVSDDGQLNVAEG